MGVLYLYKGAAYNTAAEVTGVDARIEGLGIGYNRSGVSVGRLAKWHDPACEVESTRSP